VLRLLVDAGHVCAAYQDRVFRNLKPRRVQIDEVWSWLECKKANVTEKILARKIRTRATVWLWVAIDADSKLVMSHMVGARASVQRVRFPA